MIKSILTLTVVAAFALGSAFAGSCGGCGDKKKDGDKKEGTKESHSVQIAL